MAAPAVARRQFLNMVRSIKVFIPAMHDASPQLHKFAEFVESDKTRQGFPDCKIEVTMKHSRRPPEIEVVFENDEVFQANTNLKVRDLIDSISLKRHQVEIAHGLHYYSQPDDEEEEKMQQMVQQYKERQEAKRRKMMQELE